MGNAFGEPANHGEWQKVSRQGIDKSSGGRASALAESKTGC
jgi:hypothetical protein